MVKEIDISAPRLKKINEYLEKREARKTGVTPAEAKQKAGESMERMLDKRIAANLRSENPIEHQEAVKQLNSERYTEPELTKADEHFQKVSTPDWLKAYSTPTTNVGKEFISRVATLPEDPNLLYREAGRLYWSTRWNELSDVGVREVRGLIDETFKHVDQISSAHLDLKFGTSDNEDLWNGLDRRLDLYRTKRLEPLKEPEQPPLRKQGDMNVPDIEKVMQEKGMTEEEAKEHVKGLRRQRIEYLRRKQQRDDLEGVLKTYQDLLDSGSSQTIRHQDETLKNLQTILTRGLEPKVDRNGKPIPSRFNKQEVDPLLSQVQERRTDLDQLRKQERQIERQREEMIRERAKIEAGQKERPHLKWKDIQNRPDTSLHPDDEVFSARALSMEDIQKLKEGKEKEWFYTFVDEIYGLGKEETRPGLPEQYKFDDFSDFMKWKYGAADYPRIITEYKKHWDDRGRFEYAIKGLLYKPGDIKERLKAIRMLTGADLDYLYKFKYANYTSSLYEQVVKDLMSDRAAIRRENLTWLGQDIDEETRKILGTLIKENQTIKNDQAWQFLRDRVDREGKPVELTTEQQILMKKIENSRDIVMEGAMLWDSDIQSYTEVYMELDAMRERQRWLAETQNKRALTPEEREEFTELTKKIEQKYQTYRQTKEKIPENLSQEMNYMRGLSPVDLEVRKRLLEYLKTQGTSEVQEYEIRMAIWAAREAAIGSGRLPAIGSFMATAPAMFPKRVEMKGMENVKKFYEMAKGKSVMRSPAFEDLQRFYNPELFAHRFGFGGPLGERARAILRKNLLTGKHYQITKTKEWKEDWKDVKDPDTRKVRLVMEFAEKNLGISFSELLGPGFMAGGGDTDATSWRLEKGVLDELRNKFLEMQNILPKDAKIDNQALGIQLLVTKPDDIQERKRIIDKMVKRSPSIFLQQLDLRDEVLRENNLKIDSEDWAIFKRVLSIAEIDLWDKTEFKFADIDLGTQEGFDKVVKPILDRLGYSDRHARFAKIIKDVQTKLNEKRPVGEGRREFKYATFLEQYIYHEFPMTISLTDFDWSDANFHELGTIAFDRRGRDNEAMAQARDMLLDLISKPHLLSPIKVEDTCKAIYEFRNMVNNYADPNTAEKATREVVRVILEVNRNRAAMDTIVGWIPGGVSAMKLISEMDFRGWKDNGFLNFVTGNQWHNLAESRIEKWPESIAQAISLSVGYTGPHGNAWDEKKMGEFINSLDQMGAFVANRDFIKDLRREFKTGPFWQAFGVARKYWWVVPVATIAVAATQELEEEKKSGGH